QRFRHMADQAPVLIWISGLDKKCTWFNKPWLEFTGRTMEQEVGDGWTSGVHPNDIADCVRAYSTAFDGRTPFKIEYRLRRHDGVWRWVLDNGSPLYDETGEFIGYVGSCIDVTEQKQVQEELGASEDRLKAILNNAADSIVTADRQGEIIAANPATL